MNATPTESVSRLPSEEYKADTMSCLLKRHSQTSLATDLEWVQGWGSYVMDVGVPLRNMATKIWTLFCGGMKPPFIIAWTMKTPMMGNNTSFAIQTERMAAIGRREIGRGTLILAKKEPKSTRESGMVIAPTKAANGDKVRSARFTVKAGLADRCP